MGRPEDLLSFVDLDVSTAEEATGAEAYDAYGRLTHVDANIALMHKDDLSILNQTFTK